MSPNGPNVFRAGNQIADRPETYDDSFRAGKEDLRGGLHRPIASSLDRYNIVSDRDLRRRPNSCAG